MENAVDALKIAFAVIVFVIALSIGMYMFTQAKVTSDIVLQMSDITEFMEYTEVENYEESDVDRIVGLETIIPTLYKYYKENYTVIFRKANGEPLTLYQTQTNHELWSGYDEEEGGYINRYYNDNYDTRVCSFDVDEETSRREPWTGNNNFYKQNLDMFLSGGTFIAPSGNQMNYNYSDMNVNGWKRAHGFIEEYKDDKFRESLGEYTYDSKTNTGITSQKAKKKRVIIYTLLEE